MADTGFTERTPAAILEEHSKESINRINKIDRWVRRVSYLLIGLVATTLITVVAGFFAFQYLLDQVQESRYTAAVDGCVANRKNTHDGLESLMQGLSRTEAQKLKASRLADTYLPYDRDACEEYAAKLGLHP